VTAERLRLAALIAAGVVSAAYSSKPVRPASRGDGSNQWQRPKTLGADDVKEKGRCRSGLKVRGLDEFDLIRREARQSHKGRGANPDPAIENQIIVQSF
jgi:hypothetical protein